jgi:hypothetical protein
MVPAARQLLLPDLHPADAHLPAQRALDASVDVRPDAAADATVPARVDAQYAEKLADLVRVVPALVASLRLAQPEAVTAPYKPDADPSAA